MAHVKLLVILYSALFPLFTSLHLLCVALQGWYIVTYALGIYHLNLFIAFLSPKVDPSLLDEGTLTQLNQTSFTLCTEVMLLTWQQVTYMSHCCYLQIVLISIFAVFMLSGVLTGTPV